MLLITTIDVLDSHVNLLVNSANNVSDSKNKLATIVDSVLLIYTVYSSLELLSCTLLFDNNFVYT